MPGLLDLLTQRQGTSLGALRQPLEGQQPEALRMMLQQRLSTMGHPNTDLRALTPEQVLYMLQNMPKQQMPPGHVTPTTGIRG